MRIDCSDLCGGPDRGYANRYDEWLNFFRTLGYAASPVVCHQVPRFWVPFILYLGHVVESVQATGDTFDLVDWRMLFEAADRNEKRRVVEVASATRPELVHALYCSDTEWPCPLREHVVAQEFPVTMNGSFHRPEVRDYLANLGDYVPKQGTAVIVPCSATKPYPSPVHNEVFGRLPSEGHFDVIVVSGTLGLVPNELWAVAPQYDAGLPNFDRVRDTVSWYFGKWNRVYDRIVVYSDFYASTILEGLARVDAPTASYVFGCYPRDTYENLMSSMHLDRLELELLGKVG